MIHSHHSQLSNEIWTARAAKHIALVAPFTDAFVKRRGLGLRHPVHDFLFTYYSCSPTKLKQWMPSYADALMVSSQTREEYPWLSDYWCQTKGELLTLNPERMHANMRSLAQFVADMCMNILKRPPRFRCFGLHEWAMVYKASPEAIRHNGHRLRMSPEALATFVESQTICCSHYDAYRFFTDEARPFNILNPALETRLQMEQGGCLHANMDLYKWATKLWPWVGSDFIAKAFMLALEGRELDMRASPYDLTDEGYAPICVETEEGRSQYQEAQRLYAERSIPLREELRTICEIIASI